MTDKDELDYSTLARRYLDLWREQIATLASDPNRAGELIATWAKIAAASVVAQQPPSYAASSSTHRSAPSVAPPDDRGLDYADLLGRIAVLERRVAELEAAGAVPRADRARAARKRPSKSKP